MKIKSFAINNNNSVLPIHIGEPHPDSSPLEFQAKYFAKHYNINLPPEIIESFGSLNQVAKQLKISLTVLINYILQKIADQNTMKEMAKNQQEIAKNILSKLQQNIQINTSKKQ
jgi:hypothetical protein